MPKKLSLKQYLMKTASFERVRDCIEAIEKGHVTVDGEVVTSPNYYVNPKKSFIKLDHGKLKQQPKKYYIFNKPEGYICQKSKDEKTIYDMVKEKVPAEIFNSLFAVGRLDKDTEGLLILTNDGKLADKILQPMNKIEKTYYVVLADPIGKAQVAKLEAGVEIDVGAEKYMTKPCHIQTERDRHFYIRIHEGKKRQIRKMFESIGNKVIYLRRDSIGNLGIGRLIVGELREITEKEIMNSLGMNEKTIVN
jgi:16S rRNA pseudouridine516 synthase